MSVSKSVVGCVAGALVDRNLLDTDQPVTEYVPELAASGYADATVRHVLDMRSGVRFREDYLDPDAEVTVLARWIGPAPLPGAASPTWDVPVPRRTVRRSAARRTLLVPFRRNRRVGLGV